MNLYREHLCPSHFLHRQQLLLLPKCCFEQLTCSEIIPASSLLQKLKMTCF